MELQAEDGSVVELFESVAKELGRGPGIAPHDRTVSRRQVRLRLERGGESKGDFSVRVSVEVVGPNPICVVRSNGGEGAKNGEVEIAKSGTHCVLEAGDKLSLSIQEPVFFTLLEPVARVGLGAHRSSESETRRHEGERNRGTGAGVAAADPDEEEGIAEAVARWQRRKQERLEVEQKWSTLEGGAAGDRVGGQVGGERKQAEDVISEREVIFSEHDPAKANDLELTDEPRTDEDDADFVKKFGFVVEGSEFEHYGKKGLDTSNWSWHIGRPPANDSDEDEDEVGGGHDRTGKRSRVTAGSKVNQKAKLPNDDDDDDDWRGDSEGEKELLSTGKRPVSRNKNVQTRFHDLATSSETVSKKKQKLVSTSEHGPDGISESLEQGKTRVNSRQPTASTSTKKSTKPSAKEDDEEEDDDDEEGDLDGFLVDNVEEEDEPEVADDEDEWTDEDEDEDEDEDGDGEVVEGDEIDEGRGKGNAQLAGHAPAPRRPVKDNELDRDNDKPLCKYGNKCFRKNKDHLAQFRH